MMRRRAARRGAESHKMKFVEEFVSENHSNDDQVSFVSNFTCKSCEMMRFVT